MVGRTYPNIIYHNVGKAMIDVCPGCYGSTEHRLGQGGCQKRPLERGNSAKWEIGAEEVGEDLHFQSIFYVRLSKY